MEIGCVARLRREPDQLHPKLILFDRLAGLD